MASGTKSAARNNHVGGTMSDRAKVARVAPEVHRTMRALQDYVNGTGLEKSLLELVELRASYINGCAYCVDMHAKDARALGETDQRIYMVPVWHEAPFYTSRERAALAWTEIITQISNGVSDAAYAEARKEFDEKELVELTMAIVAINGWNRLVIPFQTEVGSYQPAGHD
jgi:AhpD family alkylhydroperoxidase